MEIGTLKLELIKGLLETNEKAVLKKIAKILFPKEKEGSSVLGYDHEGNAYTIEDLMETVDEADEALKNGEGIDHQTFMKEVENW